MFHPLRSFNDKTPVVGQQSYLDPACVIIGDVTLGRDCSIWPMVTIRGDVNTITIGDRTNIQDGSVLHVTHASDEYPHGFPLIIGNDVTAGHKVLLHACTIGNDCLIGMGSIVMDGAVIEDKVLLGAGSLVSPGKVLQSGYLYLGNPAKKIRPLSEKEKQFFQYSARHYVQLKDQYMK